MHQRFEHARTVYPEHAEPHAYGGHHERARTVYPDDYHYPAQDYRSNSSYDPLPIEYTEYTEIPQTRRHVDTDQYTTSKKHKMTQAEKEAKEAVKREHEAARKLEEEHLKQ